MIVRENPIKKYWANNTGTSLLNSKGKNFYVAILTDYHKISRKILKATSTIGINDDKKNSRVYLFYFSKV